MTLHTPKAPETTVQRMVVRRDIADAYAAAHQETP